MSPVAVYGTRMFMAGAFTAGYWVAALIFLNFWRRSRDRLFVMFAAAFMLLGMQSVAFAVVEAVGGAPGVLLWPYFVRLAAFTVILWAIIDKNRGR